MQDSVTKFIEGIPNETTRRAVQLIVNPIADRVSSQLLTTGGLRIKGGSASAIVQAHTAIYALCKGVLVTKAADTDMAALSGTVTNATYNVFCFFIDAAGNLTSSMGIAGSTLAAVKFPQVPENKAVIGFVIINPTGTGDFTGGTTVLDDGTVVPNAVFVNTTMPFDPSIIL